MTVKITNKTPWDTEALTEFLTPLAGVKITDINVSTHQSMPGVKREKQDLYAVHHGFWWSAQSDGLLIEIPSPKRIGRTVTTLDRLSLVGDLQSHETALPGAMLDGLRHAINVVQSTKDHHASRDCQRGKCKCVIPRAANNPVIRGSLKAKVKEGPTRQRLEEKLRYTIQSIAVAEETLAEEKTKAARLQERIDRMKAKEAKEADKAARAGSGGCALAAAGLVLKEDEHDDEGE